MQKVKIGILDEEREYVTNLTTYLQKYGKGKWEVSAFTDKEVLISCLMRRDMDILAGTDKRSLMQIGKGKQLIRLWLTNKKSEACEKEEDLYSIYRFQSAEEIGRNIEGIIRQKVIGKYTEKLMIAMYSPVGRCGKTTLALETVRNEAYGKWLYLGLEDYSSVQNETGCVADEVLYYWKERKEEKLLHLLDERGNIIASGSSFYDAKHMKIEDIQWLKEVLQESDCRGIVLDIGTGILSDFHIFKQFDYILVPYVQEERALIKKNNFVALFDMYDMEDYKEKICFLDMDNRKEIVAIIQKIFGGDME